MFGFVVVLLLVNHTTLDRFC